MPRFAIPSNVASIDVKILAVKWRRLGDTILWTSALEALLRHFPGAEIDIAFPAEYAPLFEADPRFKTRFPLKSDGRHARLAREWKTRGYDYALAFHASQRTRRLVRRSGAAKCVIHHHSRKGRNLGSDLPVVNLGQPMAATDRDLNVVRTLGWSGAAPETRIFCKAEWKKEAAKQWERQTGLSLQAPIVFAPGASRPAKRWPLERYATTIEKIASHHPVAVIAPDASEFRGMEPIARRFPTVFFTPRLEQAIGLLAQAKLYVGSDSGLKHLAAALNIPTVTLFGPESVGEWHPYTEPRHTAIQKPMHCRSNDAGDPRYAWCGVETCPLASHGCLTQITSDEVVGAIERYL